MEYDIEKIKKGARDRAILWQSDRIYGRVTEEGVINYEDLYLLGLFESASVEIMERGRDERILDEERNRIVGMLQNCTPEEAYSRLEGIHDKITDAHNQRNRKT